jgi:hypothetical protein
MWAALALGVVLVVANGAWAQGRPTLLGVGDRANNNNNDKNGPDTVLKEMLQGLDAAGKAMAGGGGIDLGDKKPDPKHPNYWLSELEKAKIEIKEKVAKAKDLDSSAPDYQQKLTQLKSEIDLARGRMGMALTNYDGLMQKIYDDGSFERRQVDKEKLKANWDANYEAYRGLAKMPKK